MIFNLIFDFLFGIIEFILSLIPNMITIPQDAINVLSTITGYGNWIIGSDTIGYISATVIFWTVAKFFPGVVIWLRHFILP